MIDLIITGINIIVLIFFAGLCNGRMDYIKLHNLDSESWKNKWFLDSNSTPITNHSDWYYFGLFTPQHQERFMYSSTILVFLTDEWHNKKWLMFTCYELIVMYVLVKAYNTPWWFIPIGIIISKTFRGLGFTLTYDKK